MISLYVLSRMENFRQKFDSYTTSEEVMADADVKGKNYLVTGATTGLGLWLIHRTCIIYS